MDSGTDLTSWIGKSWERHDVIDQRLIAEFRTTLAPYLAQQSQVPLGIFWCLSPDLATADQLGADGHPHLGLFLPKLPLPRRMWAGGELEFLAEFEPGAEVTKRSSIDDITMKTGKSGSLCFVTVRHVYSSGDLTILRERQDIVYREPSNPVAASSNAAVLFNPPPGSVSIDATPTLLFRYSAMTFNGHRIHYDHPYATQVEGYSGLVVHGPMQATLLLNRATDILGKAPTRFSYRGLAPLICGRPFHLTAENESSHLSLKVLSADGTQTMSASAH